MYKVDGVIYGCPVEAVSNIIGKKWVAQIIWFIGKNQVRYGEIQRELEGCSKKMLTQQLKLLMEKEIIDNVKIKTGNEIDSSYHLTEKGLTLLPILELIIEWGNQNLKS